MIKGLEGAAAADAASISSETTVPFAPLTSATLDSFLTRENPRQSTSLIREIRENPRFTTVA
jgi:hypothetical protein